MNNGFEVKPDGTIIAPSLEEAVALSRHLRSEALRSVLKEHQTTAEDYIPTALKALAGAGHHGLTSSALAEKIGLQDSRGLAGVTKRIKNEIISKANGVDVKRFIWHKKTPGRPTMWFVNEDKLKEIHIL